MCCTKAVELWMSSLFIKGYLTSLDCQKKNLVGENSVAYFIFGLHQYLLDVAGRFCVVCVFFVDIL